MTGTLGREVISTRQRKIAELARREPELTLTIGVTYGAFWTDGCETECTVEQRDHYPRSRVPELGTPGSVGAAGGRPPAATRPIAQRSTLHMSNDTVVSLAAPARISDPLTELLLVVGFRPLPQTIR